MIRIATALVITTVAGCATHDPCITSHQQHLPSPSGDRTITIFTGPCPGAAPQVSIEFARGGGGVFAVDDSVVSLQARWVSEDTVEIAYPASARVSKRDSMVQQASERVAIVYVTRADPVR